MLATLGFASLLPVAAYELDISSDKFLTDKVLVTTWFIQKIVDTRRADAPLVLPFDISPHDSALRAFLFSQPALKHLYPESDAPQRSPTGTRYEMRDRDSRIRTQALSSVTTVLTRVESPLFSLPLLSLLSFLFFMAVVWRSMKWAYLHMVGSVLYVFCVSGAVILNDWDELHSMVITASFFGAFCLCSYLTGDYMPVLQMFRFFLLVWNPFYTEPDFLPKLHTALRAVSVPNSSVCVGKGRGRSRAVTAAVVAAAADSEDAATPLRRGGRSKSRGRGRAAKRDPAPPPPPPSSSSSTVDADIDESIILDTALLRMAKARPRDYLLMVGYILVMLETVTFLTPAVAMGIQWITALCNEPGMSPIPALLDFLHLYSSCLFKSYLGVGGEPSSEGYPYVNMSHEHCVLMTQHCVWSDGEGATQLPAQLKAFWGFYPSGGTAGGGAEL